MAERKKLKKGTKVRWKNVARGLNKTVKGTVIAFIPAGKNPTKIVPQKWQNWRAKASAVKSVRDRYAVDVNGETYLPPAAYLE